MMEWFEVQKCMNHLLIFVAFWTVLFLNWLVMLPGSIMKLGLPGFPFFTILRIPFFLVRFGCMVTSAGLWHRLTNNLHLDCPNLQPQLGMPELSQRLHFGLMYRNSLCWSLMVPPWWRSHTVIPSLTVIRVAGSQLELCVYKFHWL